MSCGRDYDAEGKDEHGHYPQWMSRPFSGLSGWWEILDEHGWAVALVPYDLYGGRMVEEQTAERIVSAMNASIRTRLTNFLGKLPDGTRSYPWPKKGSHVESGNSHDVEYVVKKVEWDGSLIVKYATGQGIDPDDMKEKFEITVAEWELRDDIWYPVHHKEIFHLAHRIERRR